jgi:DNA-binding CsgD family transcriptional regulator
MVFKIAYYEYIGVYKNRTHKRMNHHPLKKIWKTFDEIRSASCLPDISLFTSRVLKSISDSFEIEKSLFIFYRDNHSLGWANRNLHEKWISAYKDYYYALDPLHMVSINNDEEYLVARSSHKAEVIRLGELVDYSHLQTTEYYNDFLRKQGIFYEITTYLRSKDRVLGIIDLFRPKCGKDFSEEEIDIMKILSRYITLTLENMDLTYRNSIQDIIFGANTIEPGNNLNVINRLFNLSRRETEVFIHILKGLRNSEIAASLFISETTVKRHIQNICEKLGVNNRTSIIHRILKGLDIVNI